MSSITPSINYTSQRPQSLNFCALVVLWLTPLIVVVDTINGVMLRMGYLSISQPVKIVLLATFTVFTAHFRKGVMLICVCIGTDLLFAIAHLLMTGDPEAITDDMQWLLRFNILWLGIFVFEKMRSRGILQERWLIKVFVFVSAVLAINLIAGVLGYGYSQYGNDTEDQHIGSVGFIYAGNEMSFLILTCQIILCGYLYTKRKSVAIYLIASAVFLLFSILKATKVAMLGSILITLWFPLTELVRGIIKMRIKSQRIFIFALLGTMASLAIAPWAIMLIQKVGIIQRINYFINENGILFAIFSGRELMASKFFTDIWSQNDLLQYVLGLGRHAMLDKLDQRPIEIDPLDILGAYGILGCFLYFGFFALRAIFSLKEFLKSDDGSSDIIIALVVFVFIISATAGHVMYSGLAIPYMALAFGFYSRTNSRPPTINTNNAYQPAARR